ncbi:hypothetical protein NCLIV_010840 [Neospora caninum Liverpool]|uniref:Pyridoxal phosphate homeostasis protein n=1 Tax=Neospora caninum (strain Liverpool) TaxID=572307 RepID=F0VAC7_NEOCL|nr:hypothetical protein NCLIV_010840 [Neospora caninum Liverpool]CBZ50616.1 hypothetical protein NCLIV_010840 [Neospora caninum Liverpool]CEL65228.1 TPA: pyridoxal phosphate enzyme, YggS family protein [Neospora caninum Liverpool]|eukprot:XP_003880649.1 hypothetical protein NCLIV_010840 [Neospora caninum Liverpool]
MATDAASLDCRIRENLQRVRGEVRALASRHAPPSASSPSATSSAATGAAAGRLKVRILAVSKHHPAAAVAAAAQAGQRHFGENYVQELVDKAAQLRELDLEWHMIGHLQSNKVKQLLTACPRLYAVETVDSKKLAKTLNDAAAAVLPQRNGAPLRVLVQVNASDEESKSGVRLHANDNPDEKTAGTSGDSAVRELVEYIIDSCPHLRFSGLMTIGDPDPERTPGTFAKLAKLRLDLLELPRVRQVFAPRAENVHGRAEGKRAVQAEPPEGNEHCGDSDAERDTDERFELSMGMSGDMAEAIKHGSTEVRIGTAIFGSRPAQPKSRS